VTPSPDHVLIAPILIPLIAGALMLFYDERQRRQRRTIALVSAMAQLAVAVELLDMVIQEGSPRIGLYLLGNWPPPFAIVLVLDRLSALMLLLTVLLAIPALVFSMARWDARGQHFHSLFQFLLMGLNGAFLTGDLFNLFVFFEVLLAASYGLALHGSGPLRVRAGLHYIAINLAASLLFLIGVSLI
jgi:multicomponent K+:H+ antiporter subunit D